MSKAKPFTAEQDAWLRKHHAPDRIIRDLTVEYNAAFGEKRSVDTMKHHCRRIGLEQERRNFTPEQDTWLREHSGQLSCKDMTSAFNATFGAHRSEGVIKVYCNRKLRIGFLNNHYGRGGEPIGTEVIRQGYVWVKISNKIPKEGERSGQINWKQKAHLVWEQHYGSMPPEGYTIVFLDQNKLNTDISNLYAVSGRVLREMSKKSWWRTDPDFTLTAIKWCELFYAMKDFN